MDNMDEIDYGVPEAQTRRVFRYAALKRTKSDVPLSERVQLERVLGVTVGSNASVDCSQTAGVVAYPAGGTVVLLNTRRSRQLQQQQHVLTSSRRAITAVRFSCDGQYLVTGESGHQPAVRVWDVQRRCQIQHFCSHKHGVTCVGFSPDNQYVVSVGFQHDMIVNVWDWQRNLKVASNKVSSRVKAVSFADNGSYFVTVGNRHVKFWYLKLSRPSKMEAVPLTGRSAILGEQRNNYFCDVACGRGEAGDSTFAITRSGLLCEFNNRRLLDKWVELRTESAFCMTACEQYIFIGCSDGLVRCFSPQTLHFITTLPRPHYLGVDVSRGLNISHMASSPAGSRYPDCVGVCFDVTSGKLSCFYNDHSIYMWDVRDIRKVGKSSSYLYHSACIWGVETYPHLDDSAAKSAALPAGSFITCSSDDTVRVWNLDPQLPASAARLQRNIYSNELLKVFYMDPSLQHLKDCESAGSGSVSEAGGGNGGAVGEKQETVSYDCRNGVRCICISPDGKSLASGDRQGNVRVHDLQLLEEQCKIEAHDGEVLSLEYSRPDTGLRLLASTSRDRLIHLFNVQQECEFIQTLDDHSSSITAVRFYQQQGRIGMVSCGADRSVIFRQTVPSVSDLTAPSPEPVQFALSHHVVGKTSLYDIEVDHSQRHVLTACQDRNVRVYSVVSGKHSRSFRASAGEDGTLIKLALDQSGIYLATSCTDKTLSIYDYYSGDCMAVMCGHSELVTGLRFTRDCRHLISVSGDGCVFVWRVPHDMHQTMCARLQQQMRRGRRRQTQSVAPIVPLSGTEVPDHKPSVVPAFSPDPAADPGYDSTVNDRDLSDTDYRFSVGQLPQWAKKKVSETCSSPTGDRPIDFPKGRWAQRVESSGIVVKSIYNTDSVIPFPGYGTDSLRASSVPDSEGSKDSSLEETRRLPNKSSKLTTLSSDPSIISSKNARNLNDDSSDLGSYRPDEGTTDHDGDIDSGPESTENEASEPPVYFPQPTSDELSSSHYTVNAMDQEELRRSVRRYRRARPNRLPLSQLSLSDSAALSTCADDSDLDFDLEDEEDASTPSADTDPLSKRLGNTISTSMESLSVTTRQERFMANNFTLGEDLQSHDITDNNDSLNNKSSISKQYHDRAVELSTSIERSEESQRRRSELHRRIQQTRQQLHSIGVRSSSGLRGSKSVCDLSMTGVVATSSGTPSRRAPLHHHAPTTGSSSSRARVQSGSRQLRAGGVSDCGGEEGDSEGSLRRAVSLSDLTDANTPRRILAPAQPVSGRRQNMKKSRTNLSMSRSASTKSINQCDGDSVKMPRLSGAMRPTIASSNKQKPSLSSPVGTSGFPAGSRHRQSSSALGGSFDPCDSSSEGHASPVQRRESRTINKQSAPAHVNGNSHTDRAARRRSSSLSASDRLELPPALTVPTMSKTLSNSELNHQPELSKSGPSLEKIPVDQLPLSEESCSALSDSLRQASERLCAFYDRVVSVSADSSLSSNHRDSLQQLSLQLQQAAATSSRLLHELNPNNNSNSGGGSSEDKVEVGDGPNGATDPALLHVMQQYSDALFNMVQKRMKQGDASS